ncbi:MULTISPECIES: DUF397 domain-containing protein [unclassified Streptomyces]|uniref:DUF397 domain-containing protein n=1 Tax=unclassified Streptomyces TaxID=2593676 RepID=UPI0022AF6808|nr:MULTISPECIES: DUF397 domain-containing protein [unclassified Streptomyces]MCZ4097294.1 DUF397 domain-containing protein [Streptomyces sp. H39-C1]MCZ4120598.1 DUF397 domain-containing protein [Streptomyces sp. H39-S7]
MSNTPDPSGSTQWVKSTYSGGEGGQCIEWSPAAAVTGVVPVRDSKDPHGPALTFTPDAWASFVAGVQSGEFPTA